MAFGVRRLAQEDGPQFQQAGFHRAEVPLDRHQVHIPGVHLAGVGHGGRQVRLQAVTAIEGLEVGPHRRVLLPADGPPFDPQGDPPFKAVMRQPLLGVLEQRRHLGAGLGRQPRLAGGQPGLEAPPLVEGRAEALLVRAVDRDDEAVVGEDDVAVA